MKTNFENMTEEERKKAWVNLYKTMLKLRVINWISFLSLCGIELYHIFFGGFSVSIWWAIISLAILLHTMSVVKDSREIIIDKYGYDYYKEIGGK